jgi:hypothetical protein
MLGTKRPPEVPEIWVVRVSPLKFARLVLVSDGAGVGKVEPNVDSNSERIEVALGYFLIVNIDLVKAIVISGDCVDM